MAASSQHIDHPLTPIFDEHSRIPMLGTMASPASRKIGFFYGHAHNRFWPVLTSLFGESDPKTNEGRTKFLLDKHIALWDVLASCSIQGASDASITDAVPHDLDPLFAAAPLRAVFTTGATAAKLYRRFNGPRAGIDVIALPSTSPANARMKFADLQEAYKAILPYLHEG